MNGQVNQRRTKKGSNRGRIDNTVAESTPNGHDPLRFMAALPQLAEALLAARARREDPWHRAASLSDHASLGLTLDDYAELVSRGFIDVREALDPKTPTATSKLRNRSRDQFNTSSNLSNKRGECNTAPSESSRRPAIALSPKFADRTHFILTDVGLAFLMKSAFLTSIGSVTNEGVTSPPTSSSQLRPHYDIDMRELIVAGEVILRLPVQARNLAAALTAMELAGWKSRVGNPLSGRPDGNDPHHIAGAAYSLNLRQPLIEFHADDGAIIWGWRSSTESLRRNTSSDKRKPTQRRIQLRPCRREN